MGIESLEFSKGPLRNNCVLHVFFVLGYYLEVNLIFFLIVSNL